MKSLMLATIDQVAGGSAKSIKEWQFHSGVTRTVSVDSTDLPARAASGQVQQGAGSDHPAPVSSPDGLQPPTGDGSPTGWGPVIQVTKSKYLPTGLTAGQHIAIRVAVQRKSGLSGYCDVVSAIVR